MPPTPTSMAANAFLKRKLYWIITSEVGWPIPILNIFTPLPQWLGEQRASTQLRIEWDLSHQLLTIYKSQIRPSLEYCSHVWGGTPKSSLHLLDRVQSKAIRLINNPNLTTSLQSLFHRRLVADISIFYRYFHGHCSQEIKNIISDPVRRVRTTSSPYSHPFQVTLIHKLYLTNHLSFLELLNCGTHCHPILSLNPTICHLLNLASTNLILSPFLLKLSLIFSVFSLLGLCYRPYGLSPTLLTKTKSAFSVGGKDSSCYAIQLI